MTRNYLKLVNFSSRWIPILQALHSMMRAGSTQTVGYQALSDEDPEFLTAMELVDQVPVTITLGEKNSPDLPYPLYSTVHEQKQQYSARLESVPEAAFEDCT